MKNNELKFKIFSFDKKQLIISGIYASASLLLLTVWGWLPEQYKYPRQFLFLFSIVFFILFLWSLRKILTEESKMEIYRIIGQGILGLVQKISKYITKIKKVLGIKETTRLYSDDEKRIIIREDTLKNRKREKEITQKRFSQLTDNRERLRFIYAKFIIAERKKGTPCNSYHTPYELQPKAAKTVTENKLFDLYTPVRYSDKYAPGPEELKEQYDYFSRKIKLK